MFDLCPASYYFPNIMKNKILISIIFIVAVSMSMNKAGATDYYVSAEGNDAADGLTPSSSWLTIEKINNTRFSPGDAILFRRGDAWREGQALYASSNGAPGKPIAFGAYGEGAKPLILASKDISSPAFWEQSSENVWKTTSIINITTTDGRTPVTPDVANLIFNNEESIGVKKRFLADLKTQGDFNLNLEDTLLYMYSTVNPSKYYRKIEATGIRNCENNIEVVNGHYLTFTNLDIRYSKNNGLFLCFCSNIEISNCDFSWIGGCYYPINGFMKSPKPNPTRMGNGVQLWTGNSDVTVKNCTFNQIYDAGISPQGGGTTYSIRNLRFHHNFFNNCFYSFEFWGRPLSSSADNIFFENNTCMNAGGGWSTAQRPDKGGAAHLKFFSSDMLNSNVFIRNNIFYESVDYCLSSGNKSVVAFTFDNNCYYQSSKQKQVIKWCGGAARDGGDYFMDDLKAYQTKSGQELHTIFADPKLTPESALQSDSPAVDAGINVGYPFSGSAPDMGAFEFAGDGKK